MEQDLLLLGLLFDQNMYGYQITEVIKSHLSLFANMKKPTAYYALDKMEKSGYITSSVEREGNRPERHVYQITQEGKDRFFELLRENLGSFFRIYYADDIGITFLSKLPASEVNKLLSQKREKAKHVLEEMESGTLAHPEHMSYAIEHITRHLEADILWLDSVLSEMGSVD